MLKDFAMITSVLEIIRKVLKAILTVFKNGEIEALNKNEKEELAMREYYPVQVKINDAVHYLIWYTDEEDRFLTDLATLLLFSSMDKLRQYAKSNDLQLEKEMTIYDFKAVLQ